MNLKTQKRIAAKLLKAGKDRVWFSPEYKQEIKDAITKEDLRDLIKKRIIAVAQKKGISKARSRKLLIQKRKGRRKGIGTRKGKRTARLKRKDAWKLKVRAQRKLVKALKEKGATKGKEYRKLRGRVKGGFFRSRRHIKVYLRGFKK